MGLAGHERFYETWLFSHAKTPLEKPNSEVAADSDNYRDTENNPPSKPRSHRAATLSPPFHRLGPLVMESIPQLDIDFPGIIPVESAERLAVVELDASIRNIESIH